MKKHQVAVLLVVLVSSPVPAGISHTVAADGLPPLPQQPFRISDMGPEVNAAHGAFSPAVAYNPNANEYLVVWSGDDETDDEFEIYGQRIDAATGTEVGSNDFRISRIGPEGDASRGAFNPAVAYDAANDEYLVVWDGDDNPNWDDDFEIFGQRLAADGTEVGANFALTETGPTEPVQGCTVLPDWCFPSRWQSRYPALTYNATTGEYLLAYRTVRPYPTGGDVAQLLAKRLDSTGGVHSSSGLPISFTFALGPPTVEHNSVDNEYLIVWPFRTGMYQTNLFSTRLDSAGRFLGSGVQITQMAATAEWPRVAYNSSVNEFLIVWVGIHTTLPVGEPQIFGQRLAATGAEVGANDFRISNAAPAYSGTQPDVAYDSVNNEYLVVWHGVLADDTRRVMAQRVSPSGTEVGANNAILTPEKYGVRGGPAVASGTTQHEHLVVWSGGSPHLATDESEIFGFRYAPTGLPFLLGLGQGGAGEYQLWELASSGVERQVRAQLPWPTYNVFNGELHPAMGDLDGDGLNEIVLGLGRGSAGWMAILDDAQHGHALLAWVQLPWPWYHAINGTIWPAVGDIDGDGRAEIVAGLGTGGQGYYAIFDDAAHGYAFVTWRRVSWSWYNLTQSGETHPAVANIDGGASSEIVIGLGPGGAGWLELVDDAAAGFAHLRWMRVGWGTYVAGPGETYPAAGDVDGDGYDEIVVGLGANSQGWLQVFDDAFTGFAHKAWLQVNWPDYVHTAGETHPAVGDIDGDLAHEIVLGLGVYAGQGGWFEIRDDFAHTFASLGWHNVGRGDFYAAGGATFPALGRR